MMLLFNAQYLLVNFAQGIFMKACSIFVCSMSDFQKPWGEHGIFGSIAFKDSEAVEPDTFHEWFMGWGWQVCIATDMCKIRLHPYQSTHKPSNDMPRIYKISGWVSSKFERNI
jgi:hypothetical protein